MLRNLLLVALRNLKRDIGYSLLNILGLTMGITFGLLLIFYIKDELSYDRYNVKLDRIYRITSFIREQDKPMMKWTSTQGPLGPTLKREYPEVEQTVRMIGSGKNMYKEGDLHLYIDKVFFADSTVFDVFTYPFIEGDPRTALVAPNSMVLTQSVAKEFFGRTTGVVGKSLRSEKGDVYKITGVIRDVPMNSHLRFNLLISESTLGKDFDQGGWGGFNIFTYVLLRPNTDAAAFEKKLLPMYDKYMAPIFAKYNIRIHYGVQPVASIHLHSDFQGEPEQLGDISYVYIFASVALFMLLIACINYMNLATARSARRAKEIGIRKVSGSTKSQLIAQFLVESTVTALCSLLLSIGCIALLLPLFNSLAGKSISFGSLVAPSTIFILLAVVVFVGLVAGSYPAFYLSKFNPVHVLKGSLSKGSSNVILRQVLVVLQFTVSMIMIICTWVVYNQLNYLENKDVGFTKSNVLSLTVNADHDVRSEIRAFKNDMKKDPQVLSVSTSQAVPGQDVSFNLFEVESPKGWIDQGVNVYGADEDYFMTLGIKVEQGRDFNGADTVHSIIVNQNMVKFFSWDNPIGKRVRFPGDTSGRYWEVVGVVHDFNQKSLYNPIAPLIIRYTPNNGGIQLRIDARDIAGTIAGIEKTWKADFPDLPFSYTFLDQDFNSQFAADQTRGKVFTTFSVLTILITCLGLLGLIAFTTQQRQKEISIRKIMGAGIGQIVPLLTRNFVLLVGISCVFAFPVAGYFMHEWLTHFSYSMGLGLLWMAFLLSALTVLLIAMMTVIFHAVRAAVASPAQHLRTE